MSKIRKGTTVKTGYDNRDLPVLRIEKQRGKLTLEEIDEILLYGDSNAYNGHYALLLNASEATIGGNGMWFQDDFEGDCVELHIIQDGEHCPLCSKLLPPFDCCPSCGETLKKPGQSFISCIDKEYFVPWSDVAGVFHSNDVPDEVTSFYNSRGKLDYGVPCHMARLLGKDVMVATIDFPLSQAQEYKISEDMYWQWLNCHATQLANTIEFAGKFQLYLKKNLGNERAHQLCAVFPVECHRYAMWEALWRLKEHGQGFSKIRQARADYVDLISKEWMQHNG